MGLDLVYCHRQLQLVLMKERTLAIQKPKERQGLLGLDLKCSRSQIADRIESHQLICLK
jgi:hypothetical protein